MRIVNEILLKILVKLQQNNFLIKILNHEKTLVKNQRKFLYIIEYMRLLMIRKEILHNENIVNILIDPLIESGLNP